MDASGHEDSAGQSGTSLAGAIGVTFVCVAVAGLVAWLGSDGGQSLGRLPIIAWCAIVAFGVQWVAFVPAFALQTEHFYDLVGSLTYLSVVAFALVTVGVDDSRSLLLALLVGVWALRLGTFLFRRIRAAGADRRFDRIKTRAPRFFVAWTLQGLWVFLTLCAALAAITRQSPTELGALDLLGLLVWTAGFLIEAAADRQKSAFRKANPGQFVDTGLWAWSRHPNYFGEIVLWSGVALIAASTLGGWARLTTLISPLFVILLLTRVSGIPLLERRADERWGGQPDYEAYKARTPVLLPSAPSLSSE